MATKKAKKTVKKPISKKTVAKKTIVSPTAKKTTASSSNSDVLNKFKLLQMKNGALIASFVAEFIGTFLFVTFFMATLGDPRYAVYVVIGLFLIIGGISGAMINPAMTIGAWITKKIDTTKAISFLIAESLGAVAAWSLLTAYSKGTVVVAESMAPSTMFAATEIAKGKEWYIFFAELMGATVLALGLATAIKIRKKNGSSITGAFAYAGALYIAMFVTYIILSPLGTGLVFFNPAIAFTTTAITSKTLVELWPVAIYIIAPIIGGVFGFTIIDLLHNQADIDNKLKK